MDRLIKTLIYDGYVSLALLDTTQMINRAIEIHGLAPTQAAALGRSMTAAVFMSAGLKSDKEKLSITIKGDGECGEITVLGNGKLQMRGYISNPHADIPLNSKGKLDVSRAVGRQGNIFVVKSMGLKEPYTGSARLITGEIAEDFAAYFMYSEQQPTAIALGVLIGRDLKALASGGIVLQPMPGCPDEILDEIEGLMHNFSDISGLILNESLENIAKKFFKSCDFTEYFPKYECLCGDDYIRGSLAALGKDELYDILDKEGRIEVDCQFCEKIYRYFREDVDSIIEEYGNR